MKITKQCCIEVCSDVFDFRVLPALDFESNQWFLIQKCSTEIKSVKIKGSGTII